MSGIEYLTLYTKASDFFDQRSHFGATTAPHICDSFHPFSSSLEHSHALDCIMHAALLMVCLCALAAPHSRCIEVDTFLYVITSWLATSNCKR